MIGIITGGSNETVPTTRFDITVRIWNPNFLSADEVSTTSQVFFQGADIANAWSAGAHFGSRSSGDHEVTAAIALDLITAQNMGKAAMANNFLVNYVVEATSEVKAWGWLPVVCNVHCDLEVDTMKLLDSPKDCISSKVCSYPCHLK